MVAGAAKIVRAGSPATNRLTTADPPAMPRAMKITKIITHVLEAPLSQPFAYSRAWYDTRMAMLVEIETDSGLVGWGECYGPARITAAVVNSVAPWLIGEDPLRTDFLWQMIYARLARSRPEGRRHPGTERHRHRAVGHQGQAFRRSRVPVARRRASHFWCRPTRPVSTAANPAIRFATSPRKRRATPPMASRR